MLTVDLHALLQAQRQDCLQRPVATAAQRREQLRCLRALVLDNRQAIAQAISDDFGHRSHHETELTEVLPVLKEIDHALHHLPDWMRVQRRAIDRLTFGLARNRVVPQPLGVVGVIVPWNFPLNLSVAPLACILAAGNRAMVKLSEHSRHFASLMCELVPRYFAAQQLVFIDETGGVGEAFSQLPFDHLLFTGSTQTGKQVMRAAAANLVPVTLELGGRSPALIAPDADLRTAVERIWYAKCLNAGQICITVNHVFVPQNRVDEFVALSQEIVPQRFANLQSPDLSSLIHAQAYERLTQALDQASAQGASVISLLPGPARDQQAHRLAPHLVLDAPAQSELMQREIFGPILPVVAYKEVAEALADIQAGPRPLAFYPFTRNRQWLNQMLEHTLSGGVSVNDALMHVAQPDLPFGGVGASGMGHYHGKEGFETFSKLRPVFHQSRWTWSHLMYPPYGKTMDALLRWLIR